MVYKVGLSKREMRWCLRSPWDFPGGTVVRNPPANAGDTGLSPGSGRSHMLQNK